MDIDRRSFLIAACSLALASLLASPKRVISKAAVAAPVFRPDPTGSSSGVCATCGASDHRMLSLDCQRRFEVAALRSGTESEAAV